ncbi:MAG: DUF4089 domain-containing protein, partial [Xanthobacteraceae bacterium]
RVPMTKRAKSPKAKAKASGARAAKTARGKDPRSKAAGKNAVRAKSARPDGAPSSRAPLDHFIDAAAHALALPIEPAWKGAIRTNLAVTLALAASFAEFPLPDDAEPAPVFVA